MVGILLLIAGVQMLRPVSGRGGEAYPKGVRPFMPSLLDDGAVELAQNSVGAKVRPNVNSRGAAAMFFQKDDSMLSPDELAVCQRVFNHICAVKQIALDMHREELAKQILFACLNGVKDEKSLIRILL